MKSGGDLLAWARAEYLAWWDTRHHPHREPADQLLARVYLQGAIDALKDETARKLAERVNANLRHVETRP